MANLVTPNARNLWNASYLFELRKGMGARVGAARAEPGQQGFEALAIAFSHGSKSQAESIAELYVTNQSIGCDTAFLDQKIQLGGHAFFHAQVWGLDKKSIDADVQDARNIVALVAAPADPNVL
jgi:hypothetical protein